MADIYRDYLKKISKTYTRADATPRGAGIVS